MVRFESSIYKHNLHKRRAETGSDIEAQLPLVKKLILGYGGSHPLRLALGASADIHS